MPSRASKRVKRTLSEDDGWPCSDEDEAEPNLLDMFYDSPCDNCTAQDIRCHAQLYNSKKWTSCIFCRGRKQGCTALATFPAIKMSTNKVLHVANSWQDLVMRGRHVTKGKRLEHSKLRKVQLQWDAEEYFRRLGKRNFGLQEPFEASMLQGFPPIELSQYLLPTDAARGGVIANPFIVTDIKDRVILWFLPGVFTPSRQDAIRKATDGLKSALSKPKQVTGWRTDASYYKSEADGGVLNVSPAWHAQAHEASNAVASALGWTSAAMAL
ncbi:hypothetical protein PAXINDRAFT_15512 [Paxillus involutus ATCC 200175]|uniref:Uncharacterized protein n=1 Tax=Paxillus involutus ATCC 200175 TaxID=664439 RepID=A0A0C9TLU5_PAXIN|nr:hypothetical protein PAXINDRAFT_15512 [Paxillus involutus ATCC 200175]